jgi:signal transduction histidine kinase
MDYRKIEEGKMEMEFEEVEIVSFVRKIAENARLLAEKKNLKLIFENSLVEGYVEVDKIRFSQVIQNLIDNAIKYTNVGFVKISVDKKQNSAVICVSDSGLGMSKELQTKLFGQFVRDPSIKKEIRGTGLGLYIAKYIVEAHKGEIWAESEGEGKGSRFYVSIPLKL